jgi:hypothetical protein
MACGRWLKKIAHRVKDWVEDAKELVGGSTGDIVGKLTAELGDVGPAVEAIKEAMLNFKLWIGILKMSSLLSM